MAAENIIVGFCTHMPLDRIETFCRSVRSVLPADNTEIVLITDEPATYADRLRDLDVSFRLTPCDHRPSARKVEKLFKRIAVHGARLASGGLVDRQIWGGAGARFLPTMLEAWSHPMTARWRGYEAAVKERPYAKRVLLTDTKDVVVQTDFFSALAGERVELFQEDYTMDQARWTSRWIARGFGKAAAESMTGVRVICAGTVLGARGPALHFLERIRSMFTRYPYRTVDQGTINWLLHKEGDPNYVVRVPNLAGAVATLSGDKAIHEVEVRDGLIVRRSDGSVIPIVHMWDRWQKTKGPVLDRYLGHPAEAADQVARP